MTRLDVLDSAIKIGLGAAIAAVASWVSLAISARNDSRKEIRRRRLDIIQQAGTDFEKQSAVFLNLNAIYVGCLIWHFQKGDVAAELALKNMSLVMEITGKEVGPALHELHRIEAQLVTVGCNDAAKAVELFRLACTDLQAATRHPVFQKAEVPTVADFTKLSAAMSASRTRFFTAIQLEFERV